MQKFNLNLANLAAIKFLLIILIVCIHASPIITQQVSLDISFQVYISQIIGRIAVPLYFFISGYLMSLGLEAFTDWRRKIKSRLSSIVIPYLIWNGLYGLLLLILAHRFGVATSFLGLENPLVIGSKIFIAPAISPLWFLRDLFLFQLCIVAILYMAKWIRFILLIGLIGFWLYDFHFYKSSISTEGALFFFLGFINLLPAFHLFKRHKNVTLIIALSLSVADLFMRYGDFWYSFLFHRLTIACLCYSFIVLFISSNYFNTTLVKLKNISNYSFYIFVLHFPLLYVVHHFLNSNNIMHYILKIIMVIAVSMGIGFVINLFPKLSNLLTGSRS